MTAWRKLLEGWLGLCRQTGWLCAPFALLLSHVFRVLLAAKAAVAHCLSPMAVTREIFLS